MQDHKLKLSDVVTELGTLVEDAIDFIETEQEPAWAIAEKYYKGGTDLPEYEGRSNVVKTEVRDAIRNTLPSVMRVLLQTRKPVVYLPSSIKHADWVDQQAEYVNQLFWSNNGYFHLFTAISEALKLRLGILKVHWVPNPRHTYQKYTKATEALLDELLESPLFEVLDYEYTEDEDVTSMGNERTYTIEGYKVEENGKIVLEAVPNYEFFISRNVNSIEDAIERGVHGHRTLATVAEALELGIPDDIDWEQLDAEDPEDRGHTTSSTERRGYTKDSPNANKDVDILNYEFTLTEAYASYDLKGEGSPQLYKFLLGGTNNKYLHHEQVEDSPFALVVPSPVPFTVYGDSHTDLTANEQDTSSSLLRAMIDNAHAANGTKFAADPTKTNFDDLMNPAINAPVRKRAGDTLQMIQIPFTGQGNLATLQYLDQDIQNKVGVSKAAQGLDPDALQSTDKDAVRNTIMTGQGQTELMVRNIVETGLIRAFKLMLRLSIRHHAPLQILNTKGKNIPINITMFDPDASAQPNVGIGTANQVQKSASMMFVYQQQKELMAQYGPNNPFTSFSQMYNALEDILEANSIYNPGRYFNVVTPSVEKVWAEAQEKAKAAAQQAAAENAPMDPSKAYLTVEAQRSLVKKMEIAAQTQQRANELMLKALESSEKMDLERDKLEYEQAIALDERGNPNLTRRVEEEQETNERIQTTDATRTRPSGE